MLVFDRAMLRHRRERAAARWGGHAFLKREIAERLIERLDDVRRGFALAHDHRSHGDEVAAALGARSIVERLIRSDLGEGFARQAQGPAVVADEEQLPFAAAQFDLVLSAMSLHWVNDLPGTLIQIGRILKPDGLFLGALLGGGTLWQLRQALAAAESEIDVEYESALALMRDLSAMGESNLVVERRRQATRRATLLRAAELYAERFALPSGRVVASFEVLFLHGWAPHASQPKPLAPGSAAQRLADALGTSELSAGEKVERS